LAGCVAALGCATTAKTLANPVSDDDVRSVQRASGNGALERNYVTSPVTMSGDASDPDGQTVTVFTSVWEQRTGARSPDDEPAGGCASVGLAAQQGHRRDVLAF
jgi:hypothetical protein